MARLTFTSCPFDPTACSTFLSSNNLDEAKAKNTILRFISSNMTDLRSPSIVSTGPIIVGRDNKRSMTFIFSATATLLHNQVNQYKGDADFQQGQDGKWYLIAIAPTPNSPTEMPNLEVK